MKAAFVTGPLRDRLKEAMQSKPVFAAVAYVANAKDLPLGKGDTLVCDASPGVAKAGGTVRATLRKLVRDGVSVWSLQDLHAKVVVCGKRAIIGSANWSGAAEKRKIEAGVDTSDPAVVAAATRFVRELLEHKDAVKVDKAFLLEMPDPEPNGGGGEGEATVPDVKKRHWLMASGELPQEPKWQKALADLNVIHEDGSSNFEDDGEAYWYVYSTNTRNVERIAGGDTLTAMSHSDADETMVYPPRRVLRNVKVGDFVGILTLQVADEDERAVPWSRFIDAARKVGVRKNVTENSYIEISAAAAKGLEPLWDRKTNGGKKGRSA